MVDDPLGEAKKVISVRISFCELPRVFNDLVYIDFVGKSQEEQRGALIAGVRASMVGSASAPRVVKTREAWPGGNNPVDRAIAQSTHIDKGLDLPPRVQYFPCDVGRGLDFKKQFALIQNALQGSRYGSKTVLQAEFDVTDVNMFLKLNQFRPHVVHISGNQNGGDVLLPSYDGGEIVVQDIALAGLLSSQGSQVRLVIVDTCMSYKCALRVCDLVAYAIGVEDIIYDNEAIRFYEILYQALGAGQSVVDAHRQAVASLEFIGVPGSRIPKLCLKSGKNAATEFFSETKQFDQDGMPGSG